jgi:uncharacterized membrane protein YphA (DoxX/SURF4 family)
MTSRAQALWQVNNSSDREHFLGGMLHCPAMVTPVRMARPQLAPQSELRISFGRHVYGFAAMAFAVISLVWHDFGAPWQQIRALGNVPHREILVSVAAAIELFGGIAIQWRRTARVGALTLAMVYLAWGLLWVPHIIAEPRVYDRYGNFFEQFSIFSGALLVYAGFETNGIQAVRSSTENHPAARPLPHPGLARLGYIFFGICVISFALEQLFYLRGTANFVPKWIPPGQMFWAITTTIFFALASIALLSGRLALLASRLLTAMIIGFQLLIWLPAPFADPHQLFNWAGNAQNLGIAGSAWIVADFLSAKRRKKLGPASGLRCGVRSSDGQLKY